MTSKVSAGNCISKFDPLFSNYQAVSVPSGASINSKVASGMVSSTGVAVADS